MKVTIVWGSVSPVRSLGNGLSVAYTYKPVLTMSAVWCGVVLINTARNRGEKHGRV